MLEDYTAEQHQISTFGCLLYFFFGDIYSGFTGIIWIRAEDWQ